MQRFSTRGLLLVVLIIGLLVGWVSDRFRQAAAHKEAIDSVLRSMESMQAKLRHHEKIETAMSTARTFDVIQSLAKDIDIPTLASGVDELIPLANSTDVVVVFGNGERFVRIATPEELREAKALLGNNPPR